MAPVPSDDLANAILQRVNNMNKNIAIQVPLAVLTLAAAPDVLALLLPNL